MAIWGMSEPATLTALRHRTEGRTLVASAQSDSAVAWGLIVLTVAGTWAAAYVAGGSKTVAPHGFYVPVLIAALRFGRPGALAVALAAGVAAGPLLPLDVSAGTAQAAGNWLTRLVLFVLIGQMTAYLARHSLPSVHLELDGRRLRRELVTAIERGELHVVYQPIVRLETGAIAGVEALVRWQHPERGAVAPADFIPAAERAGCMSRITEFVVDQVCAQVAEWRRGPLHVADMFKVAVNISGGELGDRNLAMHIGAALDSAGLPHDWLHLEVTETALIADLERAVDGLMELRMLGVRLAIDDFGTGESSLAHLHRFPVDVVKIDRNFLDPLGHHERGTVLAHGVIALAHAMDLLPVVEGVETPEQAAVLRSLGCDLAQGYFFCRPVEATQVQEMLAADIRFATAG